MISRATLRGSKLEKFCQKAKTSCNEFGLHDNRVYCYGLIDNSTEELIKECKHCKAHVNYA